MGSTEPLGDIVQVDLGNQHTCAVSSRGVAQCWGVGIYGQLGKQFQPCIWSIIL